MRLLSTAAVNIMRLLGAPLLSICAPAWLLFVFAAWLSSIPVTFGRKIKARSITIKKTRRRRIKRQNWYKRIRHPLDESKTITRRTRFRKNNKKVKTMIRMKDLKHLFNPHYVPQPPKNRDMYIDEWIQKIEKKICIILIKYALSLLFWYYLPFDPVVSALIFIATISSYLFHIGIYGCILMCQLISFIAMIAPHQLFMATNTVWIEVHGGDFNVAPITLTTSSVTSTSHLFDQIIDFLPPTFINTHFYLTYDGKVVPISDSILLQDLNIIPIPDHYESYLLIMHGGCAGGGKNQNNDDDPANDDDKKKKKKGKKKKGKKKKKSQQKKTKPLDSYLNPGSLLVYSSLVEPEAETTKYYRLAQIISYTSAKFGIPFTLRCHKLPLTSLIYI